MRVAICYNQTPETHWRGEARDLVADAGAAQEALAVHAAVRALGHQAVLLPLADDLVEFIHRLALIDPDMVFNLCEGFWGDARQEMNVAGVFELLGLPFTGSSALTLGMTQDKIRTKAVLAQRGLSTPASTVVPLYEGLATLDGLRYPLIVKPPFEDASQGIDAESVVEDNEALDRRIHYIHEVYQQPALVEEFIVGREINVTVLGETRRKVFPLSEIVFDPSLPRPMVCFDGKWSTDSDAYRATRVVCPARLSGVETRLIAQTALDATALLGCRDYARVDIRLRDTTAYILEVNANPDISPEAGVARSAAAAGLSYPQLIKCILASAGRRRGVVREKSAAA